MKQILNFSLLTILVVLISCSTKTNEKKTTNQQPNFVVVFIDDMGYGDIGTQGATGWTTPNLDKMTNERLCFTTFSSAQPVCRDPRLGLSTARYPNRNGI